MAMPSAKVAVIAIMGFSFFMGSCNQIPSMPTSMADFQKTFLGACDSLLAPVAAAGTCGILSNGKRSDKLKNAAACAAAAYIGCKLAESYSSKQNKEPDAVEDEYKRRTGKSGLPDDAFLADFKTSVSPAAQVKRGNEISFVSDIAVVPGKDRRPVSIEHEVTVIDAVGDQWGKPARKTVNKEKGGAGEYRSEFTLKIADGMENGGYSLQQSVYVDGKLQRAEKTPFQVLAGDVGVSSIKYASVSPR